MTINKLRASGVLRGAIAVRAEADPTKLIAEINTAFEALKETNEEKLKGIDAKFEDVVTTDKLERINTDLTDLVSAHEKLLADYEASKMGGGSGNQISPEDAAYNSDFESWFREGNKESEVKAANREGKISAATSVGSDPDGGYVTPIEWDRTITDKLLEVGQMRRHASVQSVTGQGFKKVYNLRGTDSGWVGETDGRPETNTSQMAEYSFSFGEIYANPSATQRSLEDPLIDIAAWLASEVNLKFAFEEGAAFMTGDGVNKPTGFLNYDAAAEAARPVSSRHPLGAIAEVNSGVAAGIEDDSFVKIMYDLPEERSQGAAFFANRTTIADIRQLKDADGRYIWQPPFQEGQPALILGRPIYELDGMEATTADGNVAVAYGNMAMTYRIFDRLGTRVLRDPYTNKPYVSFYTTKRIGGGLWNPEYMRYMRIGA